MCARKKSKRPRNMTWMTKQTFQLKQICCQPNGAVWCGNKKCEDHGDSIDLEPAEFVESSKFTCRRCGHETILDLIDRNGDDIYCRCFKLVIAKKPMHFCVSIRVCARCFFPHYKRIAAVMRKGDCECGSMTGWRVFLPSPFNCCEGIQEPPPPDTAFIDTEVKEAKHYV